MDSDDPKVTYEKIMANPGFLKCTDPECKEEPAIQAYETYAHAWDKHKRVHIRIRNQE